MEIDVELPLLRILPPFITAWGYKIKNRKHGNNGNFILAEAGSLSAGASSEVSSEQCPYNPWDFLPSSSLFQQHEPLLELYTGQDESDEAYAESN